MGRIVQKAKLQNTIDVSNAESGYIQTDQIRALEVEFLVDTGAAMLCLPTDIIEQLGLKARRNREVITANGIVTRKIYDSVTIQVWDREAAMEVMELPLKTPPLLGYLPLQTLDLYPNPKKHILEGNPAYDGKMIIDLL